VPRDSARTTSTTDSRSGLSSVPTIRSEEGIAETEKLKDKGRKRGDGGQGDSFRSIWGAKSWVKGVCQGNHIDTSSK